MRWGVSANLILAASLMSVPACVAAQNRQLTTAQIAKLAIPATVTILNLDARGDTVSLGSGFLVSEDGTIVTNFHVMTGAASAIVILADGQRYTRVSALDGDKDVDIAIVKIPGAGLPFLKTTTALPAVGSKVVVVGSPLGLEATVTDGVVSGRRVTDGRELLQMSAAISHGSSGGPVINDRGEVVAISTLFLAKGQSLNFAVPVRYAIGLLRQHPVMRSLAEVFGGGAAAEQGQAAARRDSTRAGSAPPEPASAVRDNISGIYWGDVETICESHPEWRYPLDRTLMILGANDVGWVASGRLEDGSLGYPLSITRVSTNANGRVAIGMGSAVVDGYQTDKGVWISWRYTDTDSCKTFRSDITWTLMNYPLSQSSGLYHAAMRTLYYAGSHTNGNWVDWQGDLAAMVVKDSVFVDLFVTNTSGGDVSATFRGRIATDGTFALAMARVDSTAVYLSGSLIAGRMVAKWTDFRKDRSYFTGTLDADRK